MTTGKVQKKGVSVQDVLRRKTEKQKKQSTTQAKEVVLPVLEEHPKLKIEVPKVDEERGLKIPKSAKNLLKPEKYVEFQQWVATPENQRVHKTQGEWAKANNVHQDTLSDWKKRDGFFDEVSRLTKTQYREKTPMVVQAIFMSALSGDVKAQLLFLKYVENWNDKRLDVDISDHRELRPEEAQAISRAFHNTFVIGMKQSEEMIGKYLASDKKEYEETE